MGSSRMRHAASAVSLAALAACAGVERQGPPAANVVVQLLKDSLDLQLDLTELLAVRSTDAAGNPASPRLQWRSGDRSVALVDSFGTVTAVGLGRTWIEVSDSHRADSAIVNTYLRYGSIHAGDDVTCALAVGGQAVCWGLAAYGSLGDGQYLDRSNPALVAGSIRFRALSLGAGSVCGLSRFLYCWGYNGVGQLGDGTIAERPTPVRVADTLALATVTLGAGTTTCGFLQGSGMDYVPPSRTGGTLRVLLCWGWNRYGQMLDGSIVNPHRPKLVDPGMNLVTLATGGHHLCGLDDTGAAWCWGRNDEGQLGDSSSVDQLAPVAVAGGHRYDMLAAGIAHTCGRATNGQVWCWGSDAHAQLGGAGTATTPVLAVGGMAFDTVVATAYHTCGLHGGTAWCWGDNAEMQLGHASTGSQPAQVAGGMTFTSISAGRHHTCAMGTDGFAWCWGGNLHGELGAPAAFDGFSPVKVGGQ